MFNPQRVRELMEKYPGSQKKFAEACGIALSTLNSVMSIKNPQADTLEKIADFGNMPIDFFFDRAIEVDERYLPKPKDKKKEERSEAVKDLISEIKSLSKLNTLQEIEIEQLKVELANKKNNGPTNGLVIEPKLEKMM